MITIDPTILATAFAIVAFGSFALGLAVKGLSDWFFPNYAEPIEHFDGEVR